MNPKGKKEHAYRITNVYPEVTPEEHEDLMQKMAGRLYSILRPYCEPSPKAPNKSQTGAG